MNPIIRYTRRHLRAATAAGVAVVALGGGGIAYAATTSGGSSSPAPAAAPAPATTTAPPAKAGHGAGHHHGARGTVTAINGGTWTIATAKGATLTVTVDAQTMFGTRATPSTASAFAVGSRVAVTGTRQGTTIAATRIAVPKARQTTPSTPSTAPPAAS